MSTTIGAPLQFTQIWGNHHAEHRPRCRVSLPSCFIGLIDGKMELLKRAGCGDLDGAKRLIQQGVRVDTMNCLNQTALYWACENGHTEVAKYLLDNGASVNLGDDKPLIAAVKYNHYDCVKLLLKYHADANCTNTEQKSPMSVALQEQPDDFKLIVLLLHYDAIPLESLDDDVSVQLLQYATVKRAKAIQKLIEENFINLKSSSTFLSAFIFAFQHGSSELAELMLSNNKHSEVEQLYHRAACCCAKNNWPNVLLKLIEKGVDINALTGGQTPLCIACHKGHESIVGLLLNNGADPNLPRLRTTVSSYSKPDVKSPLQFAVWRGNTMIIDMLLIKGATLKQTKESLLHIACTHQRRYNTGFDLDFYPSMRRRDTRTVEQRLAIIRLLLEQGANVNVISNKGDTALYRACES